MLHRFLEQILEEKFTSFEIINTLREMNLIKVIGSVYVPTYTRTDLTDALHENFGFRTDFEIVSITKMKKIFKELKK